MFDVSDEKRDKKFETIKTTFDQSIDNQTKKMQKMVEEANTEIKLELNLTIEDKVCRNTEAYTTNWGRTQITERKNTTTNHGSQQNQIEGLWYDMVPDELVLDWQDEYMRALIKWSNS